MSNTFTVILGFVVGAIALIAKLLFGIDNLQPDLIAVAAIAPIVGILSLIPVIKANGILKAGLAVVIGIGFAVMAKTGPIGLEIISGIANGLMAAGLWSVTKATTEAVKPTVTQP